ncbi:MAG: glutathione synthetase [Candidatus Nomurabacteria bacterium]|jgi:MtN3 and saliva related transmembrane protein|nr:glutathione synthetase [Candidatus Nomurabacteria bacterium]
MIYVGFIAGILSLISYLPQTIKTIRTRKTDDLSLLSFSTIGLSALLWAIYGLALNQPAIWTANAVVVVCSLIIAVIKIRGR